MIVRHKQHYQQALAEFTNLTRIKNGEPPIPTPSDIPILVESLSHDHPYTSTDRKLEASSEEQEEELEKVRIIYFVILVTTVKLIYQI